MSRPKEYRIVREEDGVSVYTFPALKKLDIRVSLKFRNHSPTGFEYGYMGSGPSQMALAILLDYTRNPKEALQYYMQFKEFIISKIPRDSKNWIIAVSFIALFLHYAKIDKKEGKEGKLLFDVFGCDGGKKKAAQK